MFDHNTILAIKVLFERHGVTGPIGVKSPIGKDEVLFVVSSTSAARMNERALVQGLMELLARKVWVLTKDGPWGTDIVSV